MPEGRVSCYRYAPAAAPVPQSADPSTRRDDQPKEEDS